MTKRPTGEGTPSCSSDSDTNERSDRSKGRNIPTRFGGYEKPTADSRGRITEHNGNEAKKTNCNSAQGREDDYQHKKGFRGQKDDHERKGLVINRLMRAFVVRRAFEGNWNEDLNNSISVFYTLALVCQVNQEDKLKSMPVLLTGYALRYISSI